MQALFFIALAGFGAQLVDGSLGMGYGLTSSTLLMAIGLTPAIASASVHLAEIGTAAAGGSPFPAGSVHSLAPPCSPGSPPRPPAPGPAASCSCSVSTY